MWSNTSSGIAASCPTGIEPANQDGEVAQFRLMQGGEVLGRLERDEFTIEAALILTEHGL